MRINSWLVIAGVALLSAACGDSLSSLNPTAPSAVRGEPLSAEAGDSEAVSGPMDKGKKDDKNKDDKDKDKKKPPTPPSNTSPGGVVPLPPGQSKVEIEGLISAVGGGSITVNGQIVKVTADTVIRHGSRRFLLSDLHVGDRVHVKATRVSSNTTPGSAPTTTLEATEVKLQREGDDADEEDDEDDEDDEDLAGVEVEASDSSASESGSNTGTFRLKRSGDRRAALTVSFTLTGTATNGTDYRQVPLTATFAARQERINIVITPLADTLTEGTETVVLTLTPGPGYRVKSSRAATIRISDATSTNRR